MIHACIDAYFTTLSMLKRRKGEKKEEKEEAKKEKEEAKKEAEKEKEEEEKKIPVSVTLKR